MDIKLSKDQKMEKGKGGWVLHSGVDGWTWVELKMRSLEKDEIEKELVARHWFIFDFGKEQSSYLLQFVKPESIEFLKRNNGEN